MNNLLKKPTEEQIAKLPRWAQLRIKDLERSLAEAKRFVDDVLDQQNPSLVWYEELVCDNPTGGPSQRRVYLQTDRITFGVDSQRDKTLTVAIDHKEADLYQVTADGLNIKPRAYNAVEIKVGER